jgi:hypothetical protein
MSTPASLLADARALIEGNPDSVGLLDRCNVVNRTATTGTSGGATYADTTTATAVPCLYEERIYRLIQAAGEPATYATHNLFLIKSAATEAIQPDYKIVVAARGDTPQLTFENPIRLDESLSPLVHLGAVLKP